MTSRSRERSFDRREFVRTASLCVASIAVGSETLAGQTLAEPSLKIGVILPQARTDAMSDVMAGIELGFEEASRSAGLFQKRVVPAREFFSSAKDAAAAATSLVRREHATVLIGGGNDEECRALMNVCSTQGVVFVNALSRSDDLRRMNCSKFMVHVEASDAMYSSARKMATEPAGSGQSANCDVVLWHSSLQRYGASQLNDRFSAKSHRPMAGASWAGWMSVKVATESFFRTGANDGESIATYMTDGATQFDGHKGAPLSFRSWDHQLRQPLYCVAGPTSGSPIARDVPDLSRSSRPARELLDELGDDESVVLCKPFDR